MKITSYFAACISLLLFPVLQDKSIALPSTPRPTIDMEWTKEKWADDKSYRQVRLAIDKAVASGQDPVALAQKYQKQGRDWTNPLAQYRWAYAAYAASRRVNFVKQGDQLQKIYEALREAQRVASPRSYEYARLRFLTMERLYPFNNLAPVGRRLIQRAPKDDEVRFVLAFLLDPVNEKQEALLHTNYLIRKNPSNPKFYGLLGRIYTHGIMTAPNKNVEANKAIAAYRRAVQLTPLTSPTRATLLQKIKYIQDWQKRRSKKS